MEKIPSTEARTRLGELLRRLERGETFVIPRNGEEAGRLSPPVRARATPMSIAEAIEALCALEPRQPLKPEEIRAFIEDGRRF